ncbi:BlaI/MecI/CopY family transcriptional regulator [Candidatus Nomurabacteria bacterium]|nr:BlaI/MecI/CopY family transcriptional regulator [Candidatus Nomurabacteria bacterium]
MANLIELVKQYGLSENEAKLYIAALELSEASVQDLAKKAKVKRTSIYYMLNDLEAKGVLMTTKRNKKTYYIATSPTDLLKSFRRRLNDFEKTVEVLDHHRGEIFKRPRIYFLQGPSGFKQVWNLIFNSKPKEYRITTEGLNFLDFVKEKYVVNEIIRQKKEQGVKSFQIITDSPYARKIIAKDRLENRQSRILPMYTKLPFTEIICPRLVAYISPRFNDNIFVVEDETFAEGRKVIFDLLWNKLPSANS